MFPLHIIHSTTMQYLRYLTDCIRGEYWDRVLVRHPELRMYNTVLKKFEFFQAQVSSSVLLRACFICVSSSFFRFISVH